ncbi:MAG: CPBP family glutamic-type intramembrane protease [Candidatus Dormibacteraeota bacterium]|nr:CPBP family glutamic-type intramembrane protease [Candidatus Dormibacteraeota bacterium]
MSAATRFRPLLIETRSADSLAWMRRDAPLRLIPFAAAVAGTWALAGRPRWLGLGRGDLARQTAFGLGAGGALFVGAVAVQRLLTGRVRGSIRVPANRADAAVQAGYYALNATVEEAFFRGLLQGGLTTVAGPAAGVVAGTSAYVLYHRLGRWSWPDVAATALVGVPMALAFQLLPGPASLLGVSLAHFGATCGFLGPGPWLLRRLKLL